MANVPVVQPFTAAQFRALGLETAGYERYANWKEKTQNEKFNAFYGSHPIVLETIWTELQLAEDPTVRIDASTADPEHLLLACRYLWKYPTETDLCATFNMTEKTVRKYCRIWVKRLCDLLATHMPASLEEADEGYVFFLSIDGTHCPIEEPRPFSTANSSYKLGGEPGVNYELGLLIYKYVCFVCAVEALWL